MILTGPKIKEAVFNKQITIEPFDEARLNPNSYNYLLGEEIISFQEDNPKKEKIPEEGYLLLPNNLYLAATWEKLGSSKYMQSLFGRSTMGRLGLFLQVSSDLGHTGSLLHKTLELCVVKPLLIYPKMQIGQICFYENSGDLSFYSGYYQEDLAPHLSKYEVIK